MLQLVSNHIANYGLQTFSQINDTTSILIHIQVIIFKNGNSRPLPSPNMIHDSNGIVVHMHVISNIVPTYLFT
jgi:hypothetical protein